MKIVGIQMIDGEKELLLKSDSSLLVNRKPFFVPEYVSQVTAYPCLILRVSKLGKNISPRFASRYYDAYAGGLHLEASNLLTAARENGRSWTKAIAIDGTAPVGNFVSLAEGESISENFVFSMNEETVTPRWIATPEEAIAEISRYMTIRQGDLIFIVADSVSFKPQVEQYIECVIDGEENLYCKIK